MYPRISLIIAAAVVLMPCLTAADRVEATIIRDSKTGSTNPAVEAGGHKLPVKGNDKRPPVSIPYNLIDASQAEYLWFPPCVVWPWSVFSPSYWHRHGAIRRTNRTPPGDNAIKRPPLSVP